MREMKVESVLIIENNWSGG